MSSPTREPRSRTSGPNTKSSPNKTRNRDFRSQSASYESPFSLPSITKKPRRGANKHMASTSLKTLTPKQIVTPGSLSPTKMCVLFGTCACVVPLLSLSLSSLSSLSLLSLSALSLSRVPVNTEERERLRWHTRDV